MLKLNLLDFPQPLQVTYKPCKKALPFSCFLHIDTSTELGVGVACEVHQSHVMKF